MPIALSLSALKKFDPCKGGLEAASDKLRAYRAEGPYSAADAKAAGVTFDHVVWAASAVAIEDEDVERRLRLWLADCAAHVSRIYDEVGDSDAPRDAIVAARQFARGEIDDPAWDTALDAALDAEEAWQYDRLVSWLSDAEPADWPLPERKQEGT